MSVGERLRKNRAFVNIVEVVRPPENVDEPSRPDCWKCRLVRDLEKTALVKTMSVFVEVSLLDVQERNSMAFVLDIHTMFRTLRETNLRAMPFE